MIKLYTFCVDIGRHTRKDLEMVLGILINSLEKYNKFELCVFTNFPLKVKSDNVKILEYFNNDNKIYTDKWINLSFNKIFIYKHLYDKYGVDYTWIDLDTVVTHNIEYINNIGCYFVDCGGENTDPHHMIGRDEKYIVPRNKWLQGNIWKINIEFYENIKNLFNIKFNFDLQSMFTYYLYFVLDGKLDTFTKNNIFISGRNFKNDVLNGLCVWSKKGNEHATFDGLNNMYKDDSDILKSSFYPGKEIHILSFTFMTIIPLIQSKQFNKLFI
jgi:hypothetical protein